jgi:hypothetical protein
LSQDEVLEMLVPDLAGKLIQAEQEIRAFIFEKQACDDNPSDLAK